MNALLLARNSSSGQESVTRDSQTENRGVEAGLPIA